MTIRESVRKSKPSPVPQSEMQERGNLDRPQDFPAIPLKSSALRYSKPPTPGIPPPGSNGERERPDGVSAKPHMPLPGGRAIQFALEFTPFREMAIRGLNAATPVQ
jgi:hypothetical protein